MKESTSRFEVRTISPALSGVDYLLVDGNVNIGKNKGQGKLLLTRTSLFAFRAKENAALMLAVHGGLVGALIGYFINKRRAKSRAAADQPLDPEIEGLGEAVAKKANTLSVLTKVPLDAELNIERTRFGFLFTKPGEMPIVYQGLMHKNKIVYFLASLGFDVR